MKGIWKKAVCLLLILLTVGFIFYNSVQPVEESKERSTTVAETITPTPKSEFEKPADWYAFVLHVRKAAHAVEFFVLGLEFSLLFLWAFQKKHIIQAAWNILSVSLAVAVADESIQILSGRGPKVQDILLDFCGAAAAVCIALLVYGAVYWHKQHKYLS